MKARALKHQQYFRIKVEGTTRIMRGNRVKLWLMGNVKWFRVIHIRNGNSKKRFLEMGHTRLLQRERNIMFPLLGTEQAETTIIASSPNAILITYSAEVRGLRAPSL